MTREQPHSKTDLCSKGVSERKLGAYFRKPSLYLIGLILKRLPYRLLISLTQRIYHTCISWTWTTYTSRGAYHAHKFLKKCMIEGTRGRAQGRAESLQILMVNFFERTTYRSNVNGPSSFLTKKTTELSTVKHRSEEN